MLIMRKINIYRQRYVKSDLLSAIVVFLVAIPLCLGIALASGAPLFSGIIAGVIGGIVVGALSQSHLSVSGPAAGMVTIVLAAIIQLGSFELFLLALVFAGILQILLGWMRTGFIADYLPSNVIQGLLCAIGILIIIKQLPLAFTQPLQHETLLQSLKSASQTFSLAPLLDITSHINIGAAIISIVSLVYLIYSDKTSNMKIKAIPAPVIAVLLGIAINEIYIYGNFTYLLQNNVEGELVNIPMTSGIDGFFSQLRFPNFAGVTNLDVYFYAVSLAALASVESLLNLRASEKLDKRRRYCSRNRELVAQGVGNVFSGLLGGIAITSVVVRSSVNIQAGAKTKLSTIFHGLLILVVVAFMPQLLNMIPLASLAIILIHAGYKLSSVKVFKQMYAQGAERFIPFIVTILAIVFTNLLLGILIGLIVSFFYLLKSNSEMKMDIIQEVHPSGIIYRMLLPQQLSFLNKASLVSALNNLPKGAQLIIDASNTKYMDRDSLELIKDFDENQAPHKKIEINLIGFKDNYEIRNHINFLCVTTHAIQHALEPEKVLTILTEGNRRFLQGQRIHRSLTLDVKATSEHQNPIAVVLSCIDSRVPVETIFDMGLGDLFSVRVAGNVVNEDILASIEFASHSGAKLIVVMGHTRCGAINAACDGHNHAGYLTQLINKISPAIEAAKNLTHGHSSENYEFTYRVTHLNVLNTLQTLYRESEVIRKLVDQQEIKMVGAIYDVKSGQVIFETIPPNLIKGKVLTNAKLHNLNLGLEAQ